MVQRTIHWMVLILFIFIASTQIHAQQVDTIPFGHMDQWIDRQIEESAIIGGATKNVYAIGPTQVIRDNSAYKNMGGYGTCCGYYKNEYLSFPGETR